MQVKPAQSTLNALSDGHVMAELAQAIHEAIGAVNAQNKAATVTLTVTIAPMKKDAKLIDSPLLISGEVSTKLPRPDAAQTLFYVDDEGNPTRTQTRQPDLALSISKGQEQNNG
jgi:hypothetical protein